MVTSALIPASCVTAFSHCQDMRNITPYRVYHFEFIISLPVTIFKSYINHFRVRENANHHHKAQQGLFGIFHFLALPLTKPGWEILFRGNNLAARRRIDREHFRNAPAIQL